ncbi:MAG: glycosyltransferase [Planctomycetaceae bacterium]
MTTSSAEALRLTMVITELDVGGAERAFVEVAKGLRERGWAVDVVSLRDAGPLAKPLQDAGIPVTPLHCGGFADVRAIFRLRRHLRKQRPAVVLSFLHQANIVSRLAAWRLGVKAVVSGVRVADRRTSVVLTERVTRCCVDHFVAVSRSVAEAHAALCHIPSKQMTAIPNGVDVEGISQVPAADRRGFGLSDSDFVILCAGRLTEQKSPMDVLNAITQLKANGQEGSRIRLLFVGDGPLRARLESEIAARQLESCVTLCGWRPDVVSIMKASSVLVLASRWEGAPNVILEAQAAGLPVIAADVDGCRDLIQDGVTGRLFPSGDVARLAEILQEHVLDSSHGQRMIQAARNWVQQNATWNSAVDRYNDLLRNLLTGKSPEAGVTNA